MMKIIKVSTSNPELSNLFLRQTSKRLGIWGDCQFFINQPIERCDWWIVCHYSGLINSEITTCDPDHIVYISMEPTDSWIPPAFFKQFSQLVLCDRSISHKKIRYSNGLTWWVGLNVNYGKGHQFLPDISLDYDILKVLPPPIKQNRISVICSNKDSSPGHIKRLSFINQLKNHPISRNIDFYGGGINPFVDKWIVIAPYKYHLVLENSVIEDYWSEKLGDSYLAYAYPVYYGCPNIDSYFNKGSYTEIDIENFNQTVSILENLLINDDYANKLPLITDARNKVLDDYNIFQLMTDICHEPAGLFKKCKLVPVNYIPQSLVHRISTRIKHQIKKNFKY